MRAMYLLTTMLLVGAATVSSSPVAAYDVAYDVAGMRDAMHAVFKSMRTLLEPSVQPGQLAARDNQQAILAATTELEEQASIISAHVPRDEISFLASSLDRYASWIRKSYEWGLYNDTQQLVHATVDVCIACHTRLASRQYSPLAEDFIDSAQITHLPMRQQLKLQTATRRFDDALVGYATLLEQSVTDEDFVRLARDYLVLALRVKVDTERTRDLLDTLLKSSQLHGEHRERVTTWEESLQQLLKAPLPEADLATAQRLVEQAESIGNSPSTDGLVNYIVASRLLYDYLEVPLDPAASTEGIEEDGAKAYYLLGLALRRIEPESWLPQSELYLEKSIRTAPTSQYARAAFDLLVEKMRHTYPMANGGMPDDVRDHLEILLEMVSTQG